MRLSVLLLLIFWIPGSALAHAWMKLNIATTEYAPYTSTDMQHNGYINHIISQAFLETGVIVEFTSLPWDEAVKATMAGEYDALSYGNFVRSREDEFWHSDPITVENLVFYTRYDSGLDKWSELSDLGEYTIGITKGYLYNDELDVFISSADNIQTRASDKDNLEALIEGEIDLFPIDEITGWYILEREFTAAEREQVTRVSPSLSSVTTHLLIPKGSDDSTLVLGLFNKGLQQLTLQGDMTRFKRLVREGFYQRPGEQINYDRR